MGTNLEEASKRLPERLRDWKDGSFVPVAILRQKAGFPLYRDMKEVLEVGKAINQNEVKIPESAIETAKVLTSLWTFRHRARAYRGFSGSPEKAEVWIKSVEVGACLSEPTVLLSSESLEIALRYGSTVLFRFKSLSGILIVSSGLDIRACEGRFRNSFACSLPQKFAGDGCVPLLRMVVSVQFCVEDKKAREVAPLRVNRGGRLAGDLGYEVRASERPETVFAFRKELRNIMLLIMCGDEITIGHVFRNRSPAPDPLSAT